MSITTPQAPANKNGATQEQFWREHAAKQKESGVSKSAYCRKHQLNYDRFYYWLRKEKPATGSQQLVPVRINPTAEPSVPKSITTPVLCTLVLRNGDVLQIHDKSILPLILSRLN
jgi:hypothetical protein